MLARASSLALLLAAASPAVADTVLGVVVFSRHGDRTSKHYSGYNLTNLGAEQNYMVGTGYRNRYLLNSSPQRILNISQDKYVSSQVYASAPDQIVLTTTATAFLQGLYPPIADVNVQLATQTINNGTGTVSPVGGYQYVFLHGEDANSPDTIWIKGDDGCPAVTTADAAFQDSPSFKAELNATRSFYAGFWDLLQGVYDYTPDKLTYAKAYDIFDLINVASIHNTSLPRNVTSDELFQLRTLADSAEFNTNYNATMPARSIGGQTFAGAILSQLNQTITSKGKLKFSLLAGSYDTFLAFFGLSNLTMASPDFFGLPDYASTMAFELFTPQNTTQFPSDLNSLAVRFLFRNGSTGTLTPFPLFGRSNQTISYNDFVASMSKFAITDPGQWCTACGTTSSFCAEYQSSKNSSSSSSSSTGGKHSGVSNVVAGVIGAMVTLGVVLLLAAFAFLLTRHRKRSPATDVPGATDKGDVHNVKP